MSNRCFSGYTAFGGFLAGWEFLLIDQIADKPLPAGHVI